MLYTTYNALQKCYNVVFLFHRFLVMTVLQQISNYSKEAVRYFSVVGCYPGYPKDNDPHQLLQVRSTSLWDLDGSVSSSLEDSSSVSKPGGSLFSVSSSSSAGMFNIGLMGNWSKGQGQWARSTLRWSNVSGTPDDQLQSAPV